MPFRARRDLCCRLAWPSAPILLRCTRLKFSGVLAFAMWAWTGGRRLTSVGPHRMPLLLLLRIMRPAAGTRSIHRGYGDFSLEGRGRGRQAWEGAEWRQRQTRGRPYPPRAGDVASLLFCLCFCPWHACSLFLHRTPVSMPLPSFMTFVLPATAISSFTGWWPLATGAGVVLRRRRFVCVLYLLQ